MPTEITLTVIVFALLCVVGLQSYFLYRMTMMVSVLRASPDAPAARALLKAVGAKAKEGKTGPVKIEVSPAELSADAIHNLRAQQG
jgi:hypothetical protein